MGPEENNDGTGRGSFPFDAPFFTGPMLIFSGLNNFPNKRGKTITLPSHRAVGADLVATLKYRSGKWSRWCDPTGVPGFGCLVGVFCFVARWWVFFPLKKTYKWILLGISSGCFRRYVFNFCVLSTTQWLGGFFWCMGFPYKFPFIGVFGRFLELSTYTEGPNIFGEHIIILYPDMNEWNVRQHKSVQQPPKKRRHVFSPPPFQTTHPCRSEVFLSYSSNKTVDILVGMFWSAWVFLS